MTANEDQPTERLDKWLWAARFFKSRGLAQKAVEGGKVHLNGQRVKAARAVKPGDRLEVTKGEVQWEIIVHAVTARRGPAKQAETLYEETQASIERREREREERRLKQLETPTPIKRPDKRSRRELRKLRRRE